MRQPTFSICIPNYNYGHLISETIDSVLNQTFQDFEIIIADNASDDNSIDIITSYKDDRIKLIKNNLNIGFAPNLQKVTSHARGRFINLLSSDDRMRVNALEEYNKFITKQGDNAENTIYISDCYKIDSDGNEFDTIKRDKEKFLEVSSYNNDDLNNLNLEDCTIAKGKDILKSTLLELRTFASFLTIIYPKKIYDKVEGYNGIKFVGPDKFFNYQILMQNPNICYIHQPLFEYRVHLTLNQISQNLNLKQQIDDYTYTIDFSDKELDRIGLKRKDLINTFVNKISLNKALSSFAFGNYRKAFRIFTFCVSAYPLETFKNVKSYLILFFLIIGPFSILFSKFFYYLYKKFGPKRF
tara:strand:+ start:10575 stop:11639 length:1065 start_codon:yes stop_codon:yes gene_type:complete